jgi:hypothetical protein
MNDITDGFCSGILLRMKWVRKELSIVANFEMKALPLSVRTEIPLGSPYLATTLPNRGRSVVSAEQSGTAINLGHMLVRSMIINMHLFPLDMDYRPW